jgi:hypothetical protein
MSKVAILHPGIYRNSKNDALTTSFLADVTVIRYTAGMTKEELLAAIPSGLTHLSFIYHYPGYSSLPFFADAPIEGVSGEQPKYRYFSDIVIDILRSVSSNGLIVDILSCDLKESAYAEEVKKIETDLGINIRYSVDKTGNPADGANWTLESEEPAMSVRSTYFTDGVLAWTGVLTTDIAGDIKGDPNPYADYITWNGIDTFTVQNNFAWSNIIAISGDLDSFITVENDEIFDGSGYAIDISDQPAWNGLLAGSATAPILPAKAPLIKNLGVTGGVITTDGGAIVRKSQLFFKIENCYSTGDISGNSAGGIAGLNAGKNGECDISGCYSIGDIVGNQAGGIVGFFAGNNGNCTITNCYSTGDISGSESGGIAGCLAGYNFGKCTIINCYSTGAISGADAGGIAGTGGGGGTGAIDSGECTITNCYSTGYISGGGAGGAGGIAGYIAGYSGGKCTITNCYSTGDIISVGGAGGIVGGLAGAYSGECIITDCYSAGVISVVGGAGGIAGANAGFIGTCTITCCVCNGGPIFGNGNPIDPSNCSIILDDINNKIFPCWITPNPPNPLVWISGGPVPPTNYKLPILIPFTVSPWNSDKYKKANAAAEFGIPAVNSFPLRVNPYLAIGDIFIYTTEFVRALAAGTTLPDPGRTAWSSTPLAAGILLRPLGRFVVVNGANKLAIYRFENVQLINGPASEGVLSGDTTGRWYTGWICTWSASGVAPVFP